MKRIDESHSFSPRIAEQVGVEKAILLKDIYYWCAHNKENDANFHEGKYWTFNSAEALAEHYPYMSRRSISRWLSELQRDGWIWIGNFNKKGFDRTKWYAINADKYDAVLAAPLAKMTNASVENGQCIGQDGHTIPSHNTTQTQINSLSESENSKNENDWKAVAQQMAVHAKGEGKEDWEYMCRMFNYTGKPEEVMSEWACKATPYQLQSWKDYFPRLLPWVKRAAQSKLRDKPRNNDLQPISPTRFHKANR